MIVPPVIFTPMSSTPSREPTSKKILHGEIMYAPYNLGAFHHPKVLEETLTQLGFEENNQTPDTINVDNWNIYTRSERSISEDVQGLSQIVAAHENDEKIDYLFMNDQSKEGSLERAALNASIIEEKYLDVANLNYRAPQLFDKFSAIGAVAGITVGLYVATGGYSDLSNHADTIFGGFLGGVVGLFVGTFAGIMLHGGDDRYSAAMTTMNLLSNPDDYVYGKDVLNAAEREMRITGTDLTHIVEKYTPN